MTATDTRPVFISWTRENGRSSDLAAALDARLIHVYPDGRLISRYVKSIMESRKVLTTLDDGQGAILMLPPMPLALVARISRGRHHVRNFYDLHTGFFYDPKWQWAARWTLRLMRNANVIVTNTNLAKKCAESGVDAYVLHDILQRHDNKVSGQSSAIVCPVSYSNDEPIADILATARAMPETRWILTGKVPESVRQQAPSNVEFSGFVSEIEYDRLIKEALLVVALTNRRDTMQRAGYEAIMRGVPLVTSDFDVLRDFFEGAAVYVGRGIDDLANQVAIALDNHDSMIRQGQEILSRRISEQTSELTRVRGALFQNFR